METLHGIVVKTVCSTVDEFVERYHSRVEERTLFVSVVAPRARVGTECAFAILLADRSVVLAGVCEVLDVDAAGMRLEVRCLGQMSEVVWDQLLARAKPVNTGAISSNDLSAYAFEFDEQTTVPLHRPAMN